MTSERRTLIRRRADSASAGVLRGETSPYAGEIAFTPANPTPRPPDKVLTFEATPTPADVDTIRDALAAAHASGAAGSG